MPIESCILYPVSVSVSVSAFETGLGDCDVLQVLTAVVLQRLQLAEVPGFTADPVQSFTLQARDGILVKALPR
jgi:hypothetical protein